MATKKACVVFISELAKQAETASSWLKEDGFEVCLVEIDRADIQAVKAGDYDQVAAVKACVNGAVTCVFFLAKTAADVVGSVAGEVAGSSGRVVVVADVGAALPQVFDDSADAVVNVNSSDLRDVILGKDVWEKPDGTSAPRRVPVRVKCQ